MVVDNKAIEAIDNKLELKRKARTPISKEKLQRLIQSHSKRAIKELVWLMKHSKNESLRAECAKAILNKSVPDVKAMQVQNEGEQPTYTVLMGNGFSFKANEKIIEAESTETGVAQEDDPGNNDLVSHSN